MWVIRASGEIAAERIPVTERRLTELVRQTWMTGAASLRGEAASDQVATSESSVAADNLQADEAWTPRLRGDGLLSFGETPVVALGALHKLLVAPIQRLLPIERGSLLTILPHGPLFRLSFAALRNPSGQDPRRAVCDSLRPCWRRPGSRGAAHARVRGKRSTVSADCRPSDSTCIARRKAAAPPPRHAPGSQRSRGARAGVGGDITRRRERHRASGAFACRRSQRAALRDAWRDPHRRSTRVVPRARHRAHRRQLVLPSHLARLTLSTTDG